MYRLIPTTLLGDLYVVAHYCNKAVSNEVRSLEDFYHMKAKKENKKPVDETIMQRTLKDIQMLQDFAIELDRRYDFR